MLFRKYRTKRQIESLLQGADPRIIEEEKAALARENAEAPDAKHSPQIPTSVGAELLNKSYKGYKPPVALKPTESSWKMRHDYEPEKFDQPKD